MSLMERVQASEQAQRSSQSAEPEHLGVEDLRKAVQARTSLEALAAIMVQNPERARNELRQACRQVLAEEGWSLLGPEERQALTQELLDVVFGLGPIEGLIADETITTDCEELMNWLTEKGHPVLGLEPLM